MFFKTDESHPLPHHPFKACIVPRPIGWVSTVSAEGIGNVAPFSFFNGVAQNPPQLMVAVNGKTPHADTKDTLQNIENTKEFVINIANYDLRNEMFRTAAPEHPNTDEADVADLEMTPSTLIKPKRIKNSPIHLECVLTQFVPLLCDSESERNTAIFGKVVGIHIDDDCLVDGKVDIRKVNPISRLGYKDYATVGDLFQMNAKWRKS
ncbi:flavin reductase family protein [Terasakiella sp. SH-1]|uniref:flavin reductase family protein n=1 Tax=Terasakiella sp. SH-1 TaxID=2560057 RepID=UPI0010742638|nr:flavin reductase family protein [Terasakiella sp. SH-1]